MNEKEIKKIISYDKKATKLYMPNEIIEDLVACKEFKKDTSSHIAFAYSYTYLCTWLYRYCHYFETEPITQERLKEILGYTAKYKNLDYIIKKNGTLEKLGYLETTTDYPVRWEIDDSVLEFQTIKEYERIYGETPYNKTSKNFKVKLPIKAFHRTNESEEERLLDGTFYEVSNTHMVPIEAFIYCMARSELGVIGFFLYAYLKQRNDFFASGVDASLEKIQLDTGIKSTTLDTYMNSLKKHNMIRWVIKDFYINLPHHLRRPNTYWANDYKLFGRKSAPIEIRTVKSLRSYEKENGAITVNEDGSFEEFLRLAEDDVDGSILPF